MDLAYDKPIGTKFIAHHSDRLESRKQWLFAAPSAGMLTIDEGAENAMLVQNKSLLPAGITAVEGRFSRGEVVKIKNTSGKVIALGMPRYNSDALELIKGKKSQEIEQILGYESVSYTHLFPSFITQSAVIFTVILKRKNPQS